MTASAKPARFYFSLRSPYSWLAHRDLTQREPKLAAALEWRPFFEPDKISSRLLAELGGTFPYTPMSRAKHLYILQDIGRISAQRGLRVTWPVDRDPVWEVPHLAYLVARRKGRGGEFVAEAYRARWEEGHDICDRAVVGEIATRIGLEARELAAACDDPVMRREGAGCLMEVCEDGVFGVPFFVQGRRRFWGLDRLPDFVAHMSGSGVPLRSVPGLPASAVGLGSRAVDDGHAGGCG